VTQRVPVASSTPPGDKSYFEKRGLQRYAGIWSLWALGVGAVISGHFSGWNFGFATGGWGGMLVAGHHHRHHVSGADVISIAEMSPALPHTGAAYSFARSSMGPWGGFVTGLFENVEYVLTPAVIVTFISGYFGSITGMDTSLYPILWIVFYAIFLALNIYGVALSYKVTLVVTLISLAVLVVFWISAFTNMDFGRWALNIGAGPDGRPVELPEGNGPLFPFGFSGVLATLPFAVWLFLAIEQVPLAAEGIGRSEARPAARHPARASPRSALSAFLDRAAQPLGGRGRFACAGFLVWSRLLDGFPRHAPVMSAGASIRRSACRGADRPRSPRSTPSSMRRDGRSTR
jgi:amino acid transporter